MSNQVYFRDVTCYNLYHVLFIQQNNTIMKIDPDLLRTRVFHSLKSLPQSGDTLEPRLLEIIICDAFGAKHVGDATYYADGILNDLQISVKTRKMSPDILKNPDNSRDFQSHPDKFLGPQYNEKQQRRTAGVEIVQRRQALAFNDETEQAEVVGKATLDGFQKVITESYGVYNTQESWEVIAVHGYDRTQQRYLISVFWQPYQALDPDDIDWAREPGVVIGNVAIGGNQVKIVERINGNSKREATCFKEYKNLLKYQHSLHVGVPIPDSWPFDKTTLMAEIEYLEKKHEEELRNRPDLFI